MKENIKNIQRIISNYIDINDKEWEYYSSMFKIKTIKKNEIILTERAMCRNVYFVNTGLLRIFFTDKNGTEKTFHFALENTFAADYESLLKRIPSDYSIQALEDSVLILMSYDMLHAGYENLRYGEKLGRLLAEDYFFLMGDKIKSIYTKTPRERYNNMNNKFPKILQRVPQHYIVSQYQSRSFKSLEK